MQMRRRTIKAQPGRYIFKRSAWVNTGPNGPTTVYLGPLQLHTHGKRRPRRSVCMRRGTREDRTGRGG